MCDVSNLLSHKHPQSDIWSSSSMKGQPRALSLLLLSIIKTSGRSIFIISPVISAGIWSLLCLTISQHFFFKSNCFPTVSSNPTASYWLEPLNCLFLVNKPGSSVISVLSIMRTQLILLYLLSRVQKSESSKVKMLLFCIFLI